MLPDADRPSRCPRALRERWRSATLAAGWPFPGDWDVPAVDAVCETAAAGDDPAPALGSLGEARAEAGVSLAETLDDLAAFCAALRSGAASAAAGDSVPSGLLRAAALGWADAVDGRLASVRAVDPLTGLATSNYLRTRLGEVYRSAAAAGRRPGDRFSLVFVAVDRSAVAGYSRLVPMLLVARAMRAVFDNGQSLALVGPSVAAVLCRRDNRLRRRTARLRRLAGELLAAEILAEVPAAEIGAKRAEPVRVWSQRLPNSYTGACAMLARLGRR